MRERGTVEVNVRYSALSCVVSMQCRTWTNLVHEVHQCRACVQWCCHKNVLWFIVPRASYHDLQAVTYVK